jgi:hypothetical protein
VPGRGLVVVRPHTPKLGGLALALADITDLDLEVLDQNAGGSPAPP